jgi:tRNA(fMet)-specific endonuclease VapC
MITGSAKGVEVELMKRLNWSISLVYTSSRILSVYVQDQSGETFPQRSQPGCPPSQGVSFHWRLRAGSQGGGRCFTGTDELRSGGVARGMETIGPCKHFSKRAQAAKTANTQVLRLNYLLDTNVCISLLNENSPQIEIRMMKELRAKSRLCVSSISAFELWYGVAKSARRQSNAQKLSAFLGSWISLLFFDDEDARNAGGLRAEMEAIGRPIGQYDLLIAGQALRHKMTLVTANVREFSRVKALSWEDWSKV